MARLPLGAFYPPPYRSNKEELSAGRLAGVALLVIACPREAFAQAEVRVCCWGWGWGCGGVCGW
jgi:hypothetical protein